MTSSKKNSETEKKFSIKIPVYYYYQFDQKYQLIGFLDFKVSDVDEKFLKLTEEKNLDSAQMLEAFGCIEGKLSFKHFPLKFLKLNELVTDYKKELPVMIERVIESLPRYSHPYYMAVLRMNNVSSLLKRRWKFMFGFSVKKIKKFRKI